MIRAEAPCGCLVTILDEEIHVWPCSRAHHKIASRVVQGFSLQTGVPYVDENKSSDSAH